MSLAFRFGQDVGSSALIFHALALWPTGQVDRARNSMERAIAHASGSGHLNTLAYAHGFKSVYEAILSDPGKTLAHAQAQLAIGREHKMPAHAAVATGLEGWARWRAGERKVGCELMQEGRQLRRAIRFALFEPLCAMHWAEALTEGQPEAGLSSLQELLASTARTGARWLDAEIHRRRGEILVRHFPKQPQAAEAAFGKALAVSRAQQTRSFELRASLDLARLYRDTNRDREARDLLRPALVGFTETPELPEIGDANRLLASLGGPATLLS